MIVSETPVEDALPLLLQRIVPQPLGIYYKTRIRETYGTDPLVAETMKQEVGVPIGETEHHIVDEMGIDIPKTELPVVQPFNGCVWLVEHDDWICHSSLFLM